MYHTRSQQFNDLMLPVAALLCSSCFSHPHNNAHSATDVTIIESEIEIEFFLKNRIESKSIFLAGICNRF